MQPGGGETVELACSHIGVSHRPGYLSLDESLLCSRRMGARQITASRIAVLKEERRVDGPPPPRKGLPQAVTSGGQSGEVEAHRLDFRAPKSAEPGPEWNARRHLAKS
jgi:hypothetical protein